MEFGIFNLMGSRDPEKPTVEVFAEVAEQTRLADELGYAIAWFAEHHFSNYCLCASPLMMVAHCASITKKIRLGTEGKWIRTFGNFDRLGLASR
jgi:alkanesulfonate monooxygenase SsuD/methylene tetrahydromethanopterin reductase-like flavin-dependent oxidoreductase (luciferase family)